MSHLSHVTLIDIFQEEPVSGEMTKAVVWCFMGGK